VCDGLVFTGKGQHPGSIWVDNVKFERLTLK